MNIQICFIFIQCFCNTYALTYYGTCIKYVAYSFLQNPIKIPDTTKLRLKAIDQDTDIDAEINYELIKGIKCVCFYVIYTDIYHHVNKCFFLCKHRFYHTTLKIL